MTKGLGASWDNAHELLKRWHEEHLPEVGAVVFRFIEGELRLMTPPLVRRSWASDLVEDALRDFLVRLMEIPLPDNIDDLRAYMRRAFRNHCIDRYRARQRKRETLLEVGSGEWESSVESALSPLEVALAKESQARAHAALALLSMSDRVVLKLELAPEWLNDEEVFWLAERTGASTASVRDAVFAADDMHALSRAFDPGDDDPDNSEIRRRRMERFRRRRARAREKLRKLLGEEGA